MVCKPSLEIVIHFAAKAIDLFSRSDLKSGNLASILNSPRGVARSKPEAVRKQLLMVVFNLFTFFN